MTVFDLLATTPWLVIGSAFVLSLLVGSFLNVVIHRLPIMLDRQWREQAREMLAEPPAEATAAGAVPDSTIDGAAKPGHSAPATQESLAREPSAVTGHPAAARAPGAPDRYNLVTPRSACPHCGAPIRAYQNVPVLSWLLLGGKCASCKAPISARYPIVELVTALLSAAVVWRFGWHWQSVAALFFTWALVALTVIDLDHQILPDVITIPLLWLGLLASLAWHPGLEAPMPTDTYSAILGAAGGYLTLWSVYWAFKLATGKEGMGYGDFKLFGAFGAWMGWQMLPLILLLSAFAGAVIGLMLILARGRDRNIPIPFGPYLAVAAWIALMWGPQIVDGYLTVSGLER